jgi:hypothetical protein
MIAVGSVLGMLVTGVGSFESSKEDHARELLLIQTVASAHLESNGIKPSKAEFDAEVAQRITNGCSSTIWIAFPSTSKAISIVERLRT